MIHTRMTLRVLPALVCCLVLLLLPLSAKAQLGGVVQGTKQGIQKGGQEVQKGVETGAEKTKEGAQAGKKAITGEENNPSEQRMKPGETQTTTSSRESEGTEKGQKKMPKTAGELPLLALAGWSALSAAGALRILRRKK